MVQKSEKTAVPVLIQGLFDRSRSRTVDTLLVRAGISIQDQASVRGDSHIMSVEDGGGL